VEQERVSACNVASHSQLVAPWYPARVRYGRHLHAGVQPAWTSLSTGAEIDGAWRAVRQWEGDTSVQPLELEYGAGGVVTITNAVGDVEVHTYDVHGTLAAQQNGCCGGTSSRTYDPYFNWTSTTDGNGHTTQYVFDPAGRPEQVTDPLGGATQMAYDDRGHLTMYTDALTHTTVYTYDEYNNLVAASDALGHTTVYTYNATGLLVAQEDPLGSVTAYGYDAFGQRTAVTDTLGHVTTYGYDGVGRLITVTQYANTPHALVTVNAYDAGDNLVRVTRNVLPGYPQNHQDMYNLVTEYGYDAVGRRVLVTDTLGMVSYTEYDTAGQVARTTRNYLPGQPQNYQNTYNLVTEYGYDDAGRQILVTDTLGTVTYTEYDGQGRVERTTRNYLPGQPQNYQDTYNLITEYGYDAVGNQTLVTDTLGTVTYTEYDELNRVKRTWHNYLPGQPQNYQNTYNLVTEYGYDVVGSQILVTDTASSQMTSGTVTYTEYDELNRPVRVWRNYLPGYPQNYTIPPSQGGSERGYYNLLSETAYDDGGRVVARIDPAGRETRTEYDDLGRQVAVIQNYEDGVYEPDEPDRDVRSETVYNGLGQVEAQVAVADERITTTYTYDDVGRLVTTTNALSGTTTTVYDVLGRRVETIDAEGHSTTYAYDAAGRLVTTTNALSATVTTTYDALGRRVATTDGLGHTTVYTYDGAGRLIAQADPLGGVTAYGYDALGQRTVITDANGVAVYSVYDTAGRLVETRDALDNTTQYGYDALGRRTVITNGLGIATRYEVDALGRLAAVVENDQPGEPADHETNVRTEYAYDVSGNLVAVTDALTHTTVYTYDLAGRRVAVEDALGHVTAYQYDGHGRRVGEVYPDAGGPITVTTAYNALGWPTQVQYPAVGDAPGFTVEVSYDALGNREVVTDAVGAMTYDYDVLYRPLTIDAPTGDAHYEYDAAGRRTHLVYPTGEVVTYTHNAAGRLQTVTDWDNGVTVYTYTTAGRLSGVQLPNGVVSIYSYDDAGRRVEIEHCRGTAAPCSLLGHYVYELDAVGNRVSVMETLVQPAPGSAMLPGGGGAMAATAPVADATLLLLVPLMAGSALSRKKKWRRPVLSANRRFRVEGRAWPLAAVLLTVAVLSAGASLASASMPTPAGSVGPVAPSDRSLSPRLQDPITLSVQAVPDRLPADGVSEASIWVAGRDESGQPIPDGTLLTASASLGRLAEGTAPSRDGVTRFRLIAAREVGTAIVTVRAGAAVTRVAVELVSASALTTQVSAGSDVPPAALTGTAEGHVPAVAVDGTGAAQAEGKGYAARFDGERLRFTRQDVPWAGQGEIVVEFALSGVRLGQRALSLTKAEVGVEENRASAERLAGLREEYAFLDGAVKQSFTLSRSLGVRAGEDVAIEGTFSAAGLRPLYRSDREGIVFLDASGREVLAYGGALVRDALGRQVFARLILEGERVSIVVPGAWLAEATYPVVVDPLIGDPLVVADWSAYQPAVAYNADDDEWLVVWKNGSGDVEGQRVRSDGTLAGEAFSIVITDGLKCGLAVAYSPAAEGYLVAWHDGRASGEWHVYAQRVAANGALVGSEIAIDTTPTYQMWPAVAYQPATGEWLVVWNSYSGDAWDVLRQRISSSGTLVGEHFAITEEGYPDGRPHVAANPDAGEYLVVWHMHTNELEYSLRARRVLTDGTTVGNEIVLASADKESPWPRVAYNADDEEYLVVWQDDRNGNWDIYGQRVSITGTLVGGNLAVTTAAGDQTRPRLDWDGRSGRYLVVWEADGDGIEGQQVWGDGTLDGGRLTLSPYGWSPDVAYGSESGLFLIVGEASGWVCAGRYGIPVADFSAAPLSGSAPLTVTFDNLSTPLYGTTGYTWTFGDGATSTLTDPVHAYTAPGVYTVTLTTAVATDTHTLTRTSYISVSGEGGEPIAGLTATNDSPTSLGQPTTLTATVTGGSDVAYAWQFGDSATGSGAVVSHTYPAVGNYTAVVTASNSVSVVTATTVVTITGGATTVTRTLHYTYDSLGRLTDAGYSTGESYEYAYDEVGNRTAYTITLESTTVTTYTYDAANRLTSAGGVTVTWDDRGNLTSDGTFTYTTNGAGRLVRAESITSTLVYTYTATGLRVAQAVDGDVTTFAWDWASGLPELLSEGDNVYLVGHETLGRWDGSAWAYTLPDGLGSVRQVTDGTGEVTATREWTPYGVEVSGAQEGLGYTGEWQDAVLGLTYLRARWYDGRTGRFTRRDVWEGELSQPQSLHYYVYTQNDSIDSTDL